MEVGGKLVAIIAELPGLRRLSFETGVPQGEERSDRMRHADWFLQTGETRTPDHFGSYVIGRLSRPPWELTPALKALQSDFSGERGIEVGMRGMFSFDCGLLLSIQTGVPEVEST